MGWLDSSENTAKLSLKWKELRSIDELDKAVKTTEERPALFFKHSTRCSISQMALSRFESQWSLEEEVCSIYYIDLLNYREVSNRLSEVTGVEHQSPQVILIMEGGVAHTASHSAISAKEIESIVSE